jgi:hypothetical protein
MIEWNRFDARVAERAVDEAIAVAVFLQVDIRDGGKFCFE